MPKRGEPLLESEDLVRSMGKLNYKSYDFFLYYILYKRTSIMIFMDYRNLLLHNKAGVHSHQSQDDR